MKKFRVKKTYILVAVYVTLIIIELFFCVPYHSIQIFRTKQYTPHTEVVGSGYASMVHIQSNEVEWMKNGYTSYVGKRVNTPQLFINISITTFLAVAIYLLMQKNKKLKELPEIDFESIAFASEDEVKQMQKEYAKKMYNYVKGKEFL